MKKILIVVAVVVLGVTLILFARPAQTPPSQKPVVVTTIIPLTVIAQNLLGSAAEVISILPPGAEPHEVTLSPRELNIISKADVAIVWGMGLDTWATRGIAAAGRPEIRVISVGDLMNMTEKDNPHLWLSPRRMLSVTQKIADALVGALPEQKEVVVVNVPVFQQKLIALDTDYGVLRTFRHRDIATLHDAFVYLAADYGLRIVGTVQELPEDTPTPQAIATVEKILRGNNAAALIGETGMPQALAAAIAADTAHTVYTIDTLEIGAATADAYENIMRYNLTILQKALQ